MSLTVSLTVSVPVSLDLLDLDRYIAATTSGFMRRISGRIINSLMVATQLKEEEESQIKLWSYSAISSLISMG